MEQFRRRKFLVAAAASLAAPLAWAQQQARVFRIGFLGITSSSKAASRIGAFRGGLRELGFLEGKNTAIEFRWANGEYHRLAELAADLVRLKCDVIVAQGGPGSLAAKQATTAIPIVMTGAGDAVASRLVASLARPGGNVTGFTYFASELAAKRLELLKEAVPLARRIAIILRLDNTSTGPQIRAVEAAANSLGLTLVKYGLRQLSEFPAAFAAIAKAHVGAVEILEDAVFNVNTQSLARLALEARLPSVGLREFAENGGLLGYGVNFEDLYRRLPVFIDKILRGANPADLPVERPTTFDLVINLRTARALQVTLPRDVQMRANKVIE